MTTESNKILLEEFYSAFAAHDSERMSSCYHEELVFEDPVFGVLNGKEAACMWEMLISKAKGALNISFSDIEADEANGTAKWIANYEYGVQKRKVENHIRASFKFKEGKIVYHKDQFNLWKWSAMALGPMGSLLGWTPFVKSKIRNGAKKSLEKFIKKMNDTR